MNKRTFTGECSNCIKTAQNHLATATEKLDIAISNAGTLTFERQELRQYEAEVVTPKQQARDNAKKQLEELRNKTSPDCINCTLSR